MSVSPQDRLPPPRLPWAWYLLAQISLVLAFAWLSLRPDVLAGFYYQPKVIALVHLITLGWITCNIFGSLYLVGPFALRTRFAGGRSGAIAALLVAIGLTGMVGHFWLDAYSGMIWSAGTLLAGIVLVAIGVLPGLFRSDMEPAVKWHLGLAFLNLFLAGLLGIAVGLEKLGILFLPGAVLTSVHAHAHLATLGWATMMVIGVGYRLLPMQLPSAIPPGAGSTVGAWILETGILTLTLGLPAGGIWPSIGGLAVAAGLGVFAFNLGWMLRNRRPPPRDLPRPDLALAHTLQALAYLAVAAILGLSLLWLSPGPVALQLATAYGVVALLGFLGQIIIGVGNRLLPMAAWTQSFVGSGHVPPETSLHTIVDRRLQVLVLAAWSLGVPTLTLAAAFGNADGVRAAALLLLTASVADGLNRFRAWRVAVDIREETTSEAAR